jgi:hypothetical protein
MSETEKPRVPLAEIRTTAAWGALTAKQAIFCERYIQSGADRGVYDVQVAMKAAYNTSSERNLTCLTYEVLANRRVRDVLAIHFNQSARDLFLADLEKSIRREKGMTKIQAQKLYAKIAFGVEDSQRPAQSEADDAVDSPQKFAIGSVIVQDHKKYIVKAEEL